MSKIISWLTGGLIKEVGSVIDSLTTTKEEKLEIKKQLQVILEKAEANAQVEVTARWKSDMSSDSFLLAFADGNIGHFQIAEAYIPIFQTLLVTVYGAYFVGRSWEKSRKIMNNKIKE